MPQNLQVPNDPSFSYSSPGGAGVKVNVARYNAQFPEFLYDHEQSLGIQQKDIYIYNIAPLEHNISSPPFYPHFLIRRCPQDQEYIMVGKLLHPIELWHEQVEGNRIKVYENGYREVTRLLSPQNPGMDQNFDITTIDPNAEIALGRNLNNYGVFWSVNNPPTKQELDAARARLEKTLKKALEFIRAEELKNPTIAREQINEIHNLAADYFGIETEWHKVSYKKAVDLEEIPCPICYNNIKRKAKKCIHCQERFLISAEDGRTAEPVAVAVSPTSVEIGKASAKTKKSAE